MANDSEITSEKKGAGNSTVCELQNKNGVAKSDGEIIPKSSETMKNEGKCKITNGKSTQLSEGRGNIAPVDGFFTSKPDGSVHIRECAEIDEKPITVHELLKQRVDRFPNHPAVAYRKNEEWVYVSYTKYYDIVRAAAKGFLKLGLQRFHSVCILGTNAPEWFYSDLAAIIAGGFAVGIYTTNSPEACLHCINTSRANIVVVEDDSQLQKILKIKQQAPSVKAIVQYSGTPTDPSVLNWNDFLELGRRETDERLDFIINGLAPNQCCSILFTSGTVGLPKAVMLSHDNLIFDGKMIVKYLEMELGEERILSYLPLSHAAAQIGDLYTGLVSAGCVHFADKNPLKGNLVEYLKLVKPTALFGVPRVWEKIKEGLEANEAQISGLKRLILDKAKSVALSHHKAVSEGYTSESYLYKFFRYLVYNKLKTLLGFEETRSFLSGAAPISIDVREYLTSYDLPLGEAFGMSESSGAHIMSRGVDINTRYLGRTMPGMRTKIINPDENGFGEVCLYGRHIFMGYLNDEENTRNALDADGWLHSGDIGICDEKSFVKITGRIKDLVITAGGENIAPVLIEQTVKEELPVVSHAVIVADGRKFVSLLITLKCEFDLDSGTPLDKLTKETRTFCQSIGYNYDTVSEIIVNKPPAFYRAVQEGIDRANEKAISAAQKIQKFTILPTDFSITTGELGPTMKLMRRVVYSKYRDEIEQMYAC